MRKRSLTVSISLFVLMLCRPVLGQDSGIVAPGPSQRPHISEIMEGLIRTVWLRRGLGSGPVHNQQKRSFFVLLCGKKQAYLMLTVIE